MEIISIYDIIINGVEMKHMRYIIILIIMFAFHSGYTENNDTALVDLITYGKSIKKTIPSDSFELYHVVYKADIIIPINDFDGDGLKDYIAIFTNRLGVSLCEIWDENGERLLELSRMWGVHFGQNTILDFINEPIFKNFKIGAFRIYVDPEALEFTKKDMVNLKKEFPDWEYQDYPIQTIYIQLLDQKGNSLYARPKEHIIDQLFSLHLAVDFEALSDNKLIYMWYLLHPDLLDSKYQGKNTTDLMKDLISELKDDNSSKK